MKATLTPMPCGDVINHCVEFVRECEHDFDLRNAGLHYRFVLSRLAEIEFSSFFTARATDIIWRTIFDGSTTLMGHPCEIRMDASEPITLVFIPKGGVKQ